MRGMPTDFHKEQVIGVEEEFIHGSFATGVALGNGFTATHAVGTINTEDALHGRCQFDFTNANAEYLSYLTTFEVFQFLMGHPIRFKAILELGATAEVPEELNVFAGCMENMDTASEFIAAGGGMRALCGDLFGFYTPENGGGVYNDEFWFAVSGHNDIEQYTELSAANANNLSGLDVKTIDGSGDGKAWEFVADWEPTNVVPGVGGAAATLFNAEVNFFVNGIHVAKHEQRGTYFITAATTELMNFGVVGMNGAASSDASEPGIILDYLKCEQLRYRTW